MLEKYKKQYCKLTRPEMWHLRHFTVPREPIVPGTIF